MAGIAKINSKNLDEVNKINSAVLIGLGTAVVGEVKTGSTFYAGSTVLQTGSGTQTLNPANENVPAGYYALTTLSAVDGDLAVGNIKLGVEIFGFVGTLVAGGVETIEEVSSGELAAGATYEPSVSGIFAGGVEQSAAKIGYGDVEYYCTTNTAWYSINHGLVKDLTNLMAIGDGLNFRIKNVNGNARDYILLRQYYSTATYERESDADLGAGLTYTPATTGLFALGTESKTVCRLQYDVPVAGWLNCAEANVDGGASSLVISEGTKLRVYNSEVAARAYALMRHKLT